MEYKVLKSVLWIQFIDKCMHYSYEVMGLILMAIRHRSKKNTVIFYAYHEQLLLSINNRNLFYKDIKI